MGAVEGVPLPDHLSRYVLTSRVYTCTYYTVVGTLTIETARDIRTGDASHRLTRLVPMRFAQLLRVDAVQAHGLSFDIYRIAILS